ncbi:hypothetical protein SAMN04487830_1592 [Pseudobutyrivibrio sp. OR37]|uniref:hypothetical protein n=1 Tax=Pseudobutyrivibrio sp. OR37 TaxID=1798186 RepID=UPI0008F3DBB7|nr:hypothetical protein [Pseudobutyrivibrio sp. OR37]SFI40131.1 hypothetical protein SAMN04487830_1592 [Pseudobutyrivibrio sp. OR37]
MRGWQKDNLLKYTSPTPKIIILGVGIFIGAGFLKGIEYVSNNLYQLLGKDYSVDFEKYITILFTIGTAIVVIAFIENIVRSDRRKIKYIVRKRLCASRMGNPLHLIEGEIEPDIYVNNIDSGFVIRVECQSAKFDDVANLETVISDCLRKRFGNYAVIAKEEDIAGRYVDYYIEDVIKNYNKQSVYKTISDIPSISTKIYIREDVYIDYTKVLNSSAIVSGKSRSGKTTAIISTFLLPILKQGRDKFGSKVVIVDPKSAELSQCPYVLSPRENGDVEHILKAIKGFNNLRIKRQKFINKAADEDGKARKWFEIGMKPCILFLDEFVSIQDMFPKKASKEKPEYCLAEFQGMLRQIATQGASAGCFLILSTAEASVGTGGLETAVNNACGIRILFKPSKEEARFLWDSSKLEILRERQFLAGDAWFSADDGTNNNIKFVKFPRIEFGEYKALSDLLNKYYSNNRQRKDFT